MNGGVSVWDRHTQQISDLIHGNAPGEILSDSRGDTWLGWWFSAGLLRYRQGKFKRFDETDGLAPGAVRGIAFDHAGRLWVASTGGLSMAEKPSSDALHFRRYSTKEGFTSRHLFSLAEGQDGRLYIGSEDGLDEFDPASGRIRHYGMQDGLPTEEVLSSYRDSKGVLWFGTHAGLVRLQSGGKQLQDQVQLRFTSLLAGGRKWPLSKLGESDIEGIRLNSSHNSFEVRYADLAFGSAGPLLYEYQLESNASWSHPSPDRTLTLVGLSAGKYNVSSNEQVIPLNGTGTAAATITLSGLAATYTGSPIAVKATTSPAGLSVSITYSGSATAPTKAGSYAVAATATSAGYSGSASGTLVISKATPLITWATPAAITSGTALSSTQLSATASVAGTFVYSPAAGTVPAVGTDTLSTTFTPTDSTDYNAATAKVLLLVNSVTAPRVVWIPDYYGGLLQVRLGATSTAITINLPSCSPNSVAINNNKAYVVCSANGANPDKILVYNATTIRAASSGTLTISPLQTITSSNFNSLIGVTFDASNNLWVASYENNQVESISASTLNTANPVITVNLIQSPSSPVALAFAKDGTLWVVGQYGVRHPASFPHQPTQLGLQCRAGLLPGDN